MENLKSASGTNLLPSCRQNRGELFLSQDEVKRINDLIDHLNFRLCLYNELSETTKKLPKTPVLGDIYEPSVRRRTSITARRASDLLYGTELVEQTTERRPTRIRKQPVPYIEEFYEETATTSGGGGATKSQGHYSRPKSEKVVRYSSSSSWHDKKHSASSTSMYRTVSNTLKSLPKLPKDTWEYSCYRILQAIKYMDTGKWFWYPVDPIADGVPNYRNIIKYPMDFQTVIERLHKNHYSSPFEWQVDVRQIFFNAFLFYSPENVIWKAAEHLSRQFEQKIASCKFVNPNDFADLLAMDPTVAKQHILAYNEEHFARRTGASLAKRARELADESVEVLGKRRSHKQRQIREYEYGILDDGEDASDYDASYMGSSDEHSADEFMSLHNLHNRQKPQKRQYKKRGMGGLQPIRSDSHLGNVPSVGYVPPPPPLQTITLNDKNLTVAQQRTLMYNLSRLASNQRKAALELVEDDLGILAEHFKDDVNFMFDVTLLSIEKQRRFFLYVNQMAKRNDGLNFGGRGRKPFTQTGKMTEKDTLPNPSEMFDASSSSSLLSDVASNFLSSDGFFSSSDDEDHQQPPALLQNGGGNTKPNTLPEYKPVDEFESTELNCGIMGNHVDFLGDLKQDYNGERLDDGDNENDQTKQKKSAWMEWKGQVIHHGMVTQQNGVPPRSVDEQIAEGFDARI